MVLGLEGIRESLRKFLRSSASYEKAVNEFIRDLQRTLIRADVNVRLVFELSQKIRKRALEEQSPPGVSRRDWFVKIVYDVLSEFFGGDREPRVEPSKTPYVMLLVGVQGSGKTTTAAKLALYYRERGYRVGLVVADVYRPAAYEQLKQLGEKIRVPVYGLPGEKDAVKIAREGVRCFIDRGFDIVIVDTAGRHGYGEEEALLEEMKMIAEAIKPDEVVLVIDAAMGQKAFDLAKRFHEVAPIGSIIVTKLDGSAKGGGALSAVAATGAVIKFVGTGEKVDELEVFNPRRFVARLLGLGDIEGLLERVKRVEELVEAQKRVEAILSGKLTLRDLYRQIIGMRKLGPLRKILEMIPGLAMYNIGEEQIRLSEEKMDKWLAIINSMTYEELDHPEIIDKSRMRRIAIGAGVRVEDVKELLNHYFMLKKMLKRLKKGRKLKGLLKGIGGLQ